MVVMAEKRGLGVTDNKVRLRISPSLSCNGRETGLGG